MKPEVAADRLRDLRSVTDAALAYLPMEDLLTELLVGWEPFAYTASRGWSPEAMQAGMASLEARGLVAGGALSVEGRRLRSELEAVTDRSVQPVVDAFGDDLPALVETLDGWSQRIIDKGWFPPDPYKRASG